MVKYTAAYFIDQLQLRQHPEGGFYNELYRSDEKISKTALPIRYSGERNFYSSIYFLLKEENFSAFHKIDSDELWHFFTGECLEIIEIDEDGKLIKTLLGANLSSGEQFQYLVKAGRWFASRLKYKTSYCLVGCTVAPGFDFNAFEIANRDCLIQNYPQHKEIIQELTRL